MTRHVRKVAAIAAVALSASAGWAHHSFSAFNRSEAAKKVILGTVKEYSLINPHGWLKIVVLEPDGKTSNWSFEMASATQLQKRGWTQASIKVGEKITVTYFPLRFGSYGGQVVDVKLRNGKVLSGLAEADRGYPKP